MIIKCTQKLLRQLGEKPASPTEPSDSNSKLGDWYANLLFIERKKCLLFTNEKTLFSFLIAGVKKEGLKKLPNLFSETLKSVLHQDGFDNNTIEDIISGFGIIRYGKTSSKSVLGSMVDIAFQYEVSISYEGGLLYCNLPKIIYRINRTPMSAIDYSCGIKELKKIFNIPYNNLTAMDGN